MKLNEMRNMKEPNYSKLRNLLRDADQYGDPYLKNLFLFAEELGLSGNSYNMIYEGFWDLYCRKAVPPELNSKKLEGWVNFVKLETPQFDQKPADAEEGAGDEEAE